jgi:hypothetical protein
MIDEIFFSKLQEGPSYGMGRRSSWDNVTGFAV